MKRLFSISIVLAMLAAVLTGYIIPHEHCHEHEEEAEQECTACVFHQGHKSYTVETVWAVPVQQDTEHPVLPFISQPLLYSEQTPGSPRAPPVLS